MCEEGWSDIVRLRRSANARASSGSKDSQRPAVVRVSTTEGSTPANLTFGAAPNAYMLVYVREDASEDEPDASLLPSEVRAAFEKELGGRI